MGIPVPICSRLISRPSSLALLQRNPEYRAMSRAMDRGGICRSRSLLRARQRSSIPTPRLAVAASGTASKDRARSVKSRRACAPICVPDVAHNLRDDAGVVRVIPRPIFLGGTALGTNKWGCARECASAMPEIGEKNEECGFTGKRCSV